MAATVSQHLRVSQYKYAIKLRVLYFDDNNAMIIDLKKALSEFDKIKLIWVEQFQRISETVQFI